MNKKILPVLLSLVFILSACTGNSAITKNQACVQSSNDLTVSADRSATTSAPGSNSTSQGS